MTEDLTMQALSQIMEMTEDIDKVLSVAAAIPQLPFEELIHHPETWRALQNQQEMNVALLETLKLMIIESSKVVTNDALVSHIAAVMSAD